MLVSAELAKEKLARAIDELAAHAENRWIDFIRDPAMRGKPATSCHAFYEGLAKLIRNTDLTDCQQPMEDCSDTQAKVPPSLRSSGTPIVAYRLCEKHEGMSYTFETVTAAVASLCPICYPPSADGVAAPDQGSVRNATDRGKQMKPVSPCKPNDCVAELLLQKLEVSDTALIEQRSLFQRETLRTSELSQLLTKFIEQHQVEHGPGPWARGCDLCVLVGEAKALLLKPLNAIRALPDQKD